MLAVSEVINSLIAFVCILQLSNNQSLRDNLLRNASQHVRPVKNPNDQVKVYVISALYQVVDVEQRKNLATINAYFDMWWSDEKMTWNPADYNGITDTYLPAKEVWIPELYLYHSVEGSTSDYVKNFAVQVSHDGTMRTFVPFTAKALCPINVKYFPFDKQTCAFMFGSWSYKKETVEFFVQSEKVFLQDFYDNQEWLLTDSKLSKFEVNYSTNYNDEMYSAVVLELSLERQSFYYIFNLVIPTTLVSVVAIIGFHAPGSSNPRRESKFRLGIMTLLSMGVMLLMVVDEMPKFSLASMPGQRGSFSDVPLLGIFYIFLISSISLGTCTTSIFVIMERFALENPDYDSLPTYLRWIACDIPTSTRDTKKWHKATSHINQSGGFTASSFANKDLQLSKTETVVSSIGDGSHLDAYDCGYKVRAVGKSTAMCTPQDTKLKDFRFIDSPTPITESFSTTLPPANYSSISQRTSDSFLTSADAAAVCHYLQTIVKILRDTCQNFQPDEQDEIWSSRRRSWATRQMTRRKCAAMTGSPVLTPHWHCVIRRLELCSLCIYLFGVIAMLIMLFHPAWY